MPDSLVKFNLLLKSRRYSERTIEAYTAWPQELARHFPNRDLSTLDAEDAQAFMRHLEKRRLSTTTLRQARCAVELFFKQIVGIDPAISSFARNWVHRKPVEIPTQTEVMKIIDLVPDQIYRTALIAIYGMGLELNEVLRIKVRHVDLKRDVVQIPLLRRRGQREALLPKKIHKEIEQLTLGKQPDDLLFTKRGAGFSEKPLQRSFAKAKKLAGISGKYTIRSLRHAYIKHLEFLGIPLIKVIDHMGLSKGMSFNVYSSIDQYDIEVTFSPADRLIPEATQDHHPDSSPYVSEDRMEILSSLSPKSFDLSRLLASLRELNIAYRTNSFMAIAMLVRSVIDHVPPIFNCRTFNEVMSNYLGSKSFKRSMEHLNLSLRNIADAHLHVPIRAKESLPAFQQVDFRADLDVLLGEIIRLLK